MHADSLQEHTDIWHVASRNNFKIILEWGKLEFPDLEAAQVQQ